jgi:hypothetical protein
MTERNNASLDGVVVGDGIFGDLFEKRGLLKGGGVLDTQLLKVQVQSTSYLICMSMSPCHFAHEPGDQVLPTWKHGMTGVFKPAALRPWLLMLTHFHLAGQQVSGSCFDFLETCGAGARASI